MPWKKITDGKLDITLTSSNEAKTVIQQWSTLDQATIGGEGVKENGYFAKYDFDNDVWDRDLIKNAPGYVAPRRAPVIIVR